MFEPQTYLKLEVGKDLIHMKYELYGTVIEEVTTSIYSPNVMILHELYEKYKMEVPIVMVNNKPTVKFFRELIDYGEPIKGILTILHGMIIIVLKQEYITGIIKMTPEGPVYPSGNHKVFDDIRQILNRV